MLGERGHDAAGGSQRAGVAAASLAHSRARAPLRSAPPRPAPPLVFFFNAQQLGDPASNSTTRVFGGFPRGPASQPRAAARAGYSLQRPTPASVRDRIPRPEQGRRRPF